MENQDSLSVDFPDIISSLLSLGVVMVDRRFTVIVWNRFMELNSSVRSEEVLGKNLFDCFPELNRNWLEKKIKSCIILSTPSYSSWRQRPYLFRFKAATLQDSESEFMYQDVSILPIHDHAGNIQGVCMTIHDVTELAEQTRLLERVMDQAVVIEESSQRDGLTGLYNRKFFDEQITQEIQRARRYKWPLVLVMIDMDHFKAVNDSFGHPVGDQVLRGVANCLLGLLRVTDTLCRYGGEEFSLILPHITLENAKFLLDRLRKAIEAMIVQLEDGTTVLVTISGGFVQYEEGISSGEMVRRADEALYASKQAGRNRITSYSSDDSTG